jgi:hypothetical protein
MDAARTTSPDGSETTAERPVDGTKERVIPEGPERGVDP